MPVPYSNLHSLHLGLEHQMTYMTLQVEKKHWITNIIYNHVSHKVQMLILFLDMNKHCVLLHNTEFDIGEP